MAGVFTPSVINPIIVIIYGRVPKATIARMSVYQLGSVCLIVSLPSNSLVPLMDMLFVDFGFQFLWVSCGFTLCGFGFLIVLNLVSLVLLVRSFDKLLPSLVSDF